MLLLSLALFLIFHVYVTKTSKIYFSLKNISFFLHSLKTTYLLFFLSFFLSFFLYRLYIGIQIQCNKSTYCIDVNRICFFIQIFSIRTCISVAHNQLRALFPYTKKFTLPTQLSDKSHIRCYLNIKDHILYSLSDKFVSPSN